VVATVFRKAWGGWLMSILENLLAFLAKSVLVVGAEAPLPSTT
jgi:hypothetical protein